MSPPGIAGIQHVVFNQTTHDETLAPPVTTVVLPLAALHAPCGSFKTTPQLILDLCRMELDLWAMRTFDVHQKVHMHMCTFCEPLDSLNTVSLLCFVQDVF